MSAVYNKVEFDYWAREDSGGTDGLSLSVNEHSDRPIVMEMHEDCNNAWMRPEEALELAQKLIQAAMAVYKAGKVDAASS